MGFIGLLWFCFALFLHVHSLPLAKGRSAVFDNNAVVPTQQRAIVVGGSILVILSGGNDPATSAQTLDRRQIVSSPAPIVSNGVTEAANSTAVQRLNQPTIVRCVFHPPILPPNICQHVLFRNSTSSSSIYSVNMWFLVVLSFVITYGVHFVE